VFFELNQTKPNSFRTESEFFHKTEPKMNRNKKIIPHIPPHWTNPAIGVIDKLQWSHCVKNTCGMQRKGHSNMEMCQNFQVRDQILGCGH